ncbi:MAG: hypothetical protein GTN84_09580 [Hydrogenophaga sp.]|uniref:hypothetical protein n=1 Tax=Hydrogenophaga sp. TaxID=1904254 RepID=UPI0016A01B12|nr:hypothetical protein [Hydrogenophaga sp.]NIM41343.1 hypothetical protein [Hydrogenophaga sp.]NIN26659.1 hypothetical protein [Hydrogenophaga sp.]NIN29981.1 hypothetical protein [Hydrogenophaga sp.]NIN55589.1 hypothetical protein [Hydrogenophaga sp.]NIO52586.1 hypothetical protein [Hydrogenophaga sp.]
MPTNPFDLDSGNGKGKIEWSTQETPTEEQARLAREEREHCFQIQMRWCVFIVSSMALAATAIFGGVLALSSTPETAKLGVGLVSAVLTGSLGFLTGRASVSAR